MRLYLDQTVADVNSSTQTNPIAWMTSTASTLTEPEIDGQTESLPSTMVLPVKLHFSPDLTISVLTVKPEISKTANEVAANRPASITSTRSSVEWEARTDKSFSA